MGYVPLLLLGRFAGQEVFQCAGIFHPLDQTDPADEKSTKKILIKINGPTLADNHPTEYKGGLKQIPHTRIFPIIIKQQSRKPSSSRVTHI